MSESETEYDKLNRLIQGYMKDFDKLFEQQDNGQQGIRTVMYEHKYYTIQEFVKKKLTETGL